MIITTLNSGVLVVEININGCRYILINSKFEEFKISSNIELMLCDPMYNLISKQKALYPKILNYFSPDIMFHFTTDSSYLSNDRNAHPENLQKFMHGSGYKRRITFLIKKYDFSDTTIKIPFGLNSHAKHVPINDTDCLVSFVHKDATVKEHWNISHFERSRVLSKYVQDFNSKNVFKPKSLYLDFIKAFTTENGWIVDMDACSGNSLEAAIELKRNFLGYEVNKEVFEKLIEKMRNLEL